MRGGDGAAFSPADNRPRQVQRRGGRRKLVSGDSAVLIASISRSSRATWPGVTRNAVSAGVKSSPGVARSAPRSNRSFWMRVSASASVPAPAATIATPMALLASSTSPIAASRASSFATRDPSTRPVVPVSPVRV
jgi:hypothetical protein